MSSVDTWPKAVQNWLKAAHISPRFRGRLAFWLAGTRFEGFVANHLSDHLRQLWRLHAKFVSGTSVPASPYVAAVGLSRSKGAKARRSSCGQGLRTQAVVLLANPSARGIATLHPLAPYGRIVPCAAPPVPVSGPLRTLTASNHLCHQQSVRAVNVNVPPLHPSPVAQTVPGYSGCSLVACQLKGRRPS